MIKRILILLLLVIYGSPAGAASLSLQDILKIAIQNNRQIKKALYLVKKSEYSFKSQLSSVMPYISLSGNVAKTNGQTIYHNIGIKLTQPVDISGRILPALKLAKLQIEIAKNNLKELKRNIIYTIKNIYYKILLDRKLIRVELLRLKSLKEHYNLIRNKYKKGLVSHYDLIRAKVDLRNAYPDYISVRNRLKSDLTQLQLLTGKKLKEDEITGRLQYISQNLPNKYDAIKKALKNRPDLKLAKLNEQMAELSLELKKKENLPQLSFSTNFVLSSSLSKENHSFTMSLNLSFPLYDSGKNRHEIKSMEAYLHSMAEARKYLIEKIKKEVTDAYNDIITAKERIKSIEGIVEQAKIGVKIAITRYKEGLSTYLDLIDSELALHTSRVNMAKSIYSYLLSVAYFKLVEGE